MWNTTLLFYVVVSANYPLQFLLYVEAFPVRYISSVETGTVEDDVIFSVDVSTFPTFQCC